VRHLNIADARGRLGRSFGVKLWPTLVLLADGKEAARLVRPLGAGAIERALAAIDPAGWRKQFHNTWHRRPIPSGSTRRSAGF